MELIYDSFYCLQDDVEEGFGKGVTTEEAIDILVKSYKSSRIRKRVKKEVAKISESVRFMLHFFLPPTNITKKNLPKPGPFLRACKVGRA